MYCNCCCSCSFEPEIITIGHSSHKMYGHNILNFQESTPISNAGTKKKSGNLLNAPRNFISYVTMHCTCTNYPVFCPREGCGAGSLFNQVQIQSFHSWLVALLLTHSWRKNSWNLDFFQGHQCEALSRIWTKVADSISFGYRSNDKRASTSAGNILFTFSFGAHSSRYVSSHFLFIFFFKFLLFVRFVF